MEIEAIDQQLAGLGVEVVQVAADGPPEIEIAIDAAGECLSRRIAPVIAGSTCTLSFFFNSSTTCR